jgi:Xaa-Pro dipeptidase
VFKPLKSREMMHFKDKLKNVQHSLMKQGMAGWLLCDFHHSNPLAYIFLEIPEDKMLTRRFFYWIPQQGDPIKIVSQIEPYPLDHLPGIKWIYKGWKELEQHLLSLGKEQAKIAMEYSPDNALPTISKVDAGTVDLIRKTGAEVVSSANLLQSYTSVWTEKQRISHLEAAKTLEDIVERTWALITDALRTLTPIDEYQVQQFMLQQMHAADCQTADPPICAVNAHSADPHYSPQLHKTVPIQSGDFILLDLWCKRNSPHSVYADITRVGVAAPHPTAKQQEIFHLVKSARNHATLLIEQSYKNGLVLEGWQVDEECRRVVEEAGYGEYFLHRTGHNIGEEVHGSGANLDNLETHDNRQLLLGTGFSIEPGIYLPEQFGIRLEYDVYLDRLGQIHITGGIQQEIICLL